MDPAFQSDAVQANAFQVVVANIVATLGDTIASWIRHRRGR